jgi:hypothetical protein
VLTASAPGVYEMFTVRGAPLVMAPMALLGMLGSVVRPPLHAFVFQPSPRTRPTAGPMAASQGPLVQPGSPPT